MVDSLLEADLPNSYEELVRLFYNSQKDEFKLLLQNGVIPHWLSPKALMFASNFQIDYQIGITFLKSLPFIRYENDEFWFHDSVREYILREITLATGSLPLKFIDSMLAILLGELSFFPSTHPLDIAKLNKQILTEVLFLGLVSSQSEYWFALTRNAIRNSMQYDMNGLASQLNRVLYEAASLLTSSEYKYWAEYYDALMMAKRGTRQKATEILAELQGKNLSESLKLRLLLALGVFQQDESKLLLGITLTREIQDIWLEGAFISELGTFYHMIGKQDLAIQYWFDASRKNSDSQNYILEAYNYQNLAVNLDTIDWATSEAYYTKALEIFQNIRNEFAYVSVLRDYCASLILQNKYEKALQIGKEAVEIIRSFSEITRSALVYFNYGLSLLLSGDIDQATSIYKEGASYIKIQREAAIGKNSLADLPENLSHDIRVQALIDYLARITI